MKDFDEFSFLFLTSFPITSNTKQSFLSKCTRKGEAYICALFLLKVVLCSLKNPLQILRLVSEMPYSQGGSELSTVWSGARIQENVWPPSQTCPSGCENLEQTRPLTEINLMCFTNGENQALSSL